MPVLKKKKNYHKIRQGQHSDNVKPILKEEIQCTEEKLSLITIRRRASTIDYESPRTKSHTRRLNNLISDGSSTISEIPDTIPIYSQISNENYLNILFTKAKAQSLYKFLEIHQIEEKFRAKMIDWMIEILKAYQQQESTIYKSIYLLDNFYLCSSHKEELQNLHITGIACMFIASKLEEVNYIKIDSFIDVIGKGKFTKDEILNRELEVLETIKFKTNNPTVYELLFTTITLLNISDSIISDFLLNSSLFLSKMCLYSYELVTSINIKEITLYSIVMGLKLSEKIHNMNTSQIVS